MSELQKVVDGFTEEDRPHMSRDMIRVMASLCRVVDCVGQMQRRVKTLERLTTVLVFLLLLMSIVAVINSMIVARLVGG
jgi:hypothetical protein